MGNYYPYHHFRNQVIYFPQKEVNQNYEITDSYYYDSKDISL